eukprot:749316-Hanusia_phi.AAC.1
MFSSSNRVSCSDQEIPYGLLPRLEDQRSRCDGRESSHPLIAQQQAHARRTDTNDQRSVGHEGADSKKSTLTTSLQRFLTCTFLAAQESDMESLKTRLEFLLSEKEEIINNLYHRLESQSAQIR